MSNAIADIHSPQGDDGQASQAEQPITNYPKLVSKSDNITAYLGESLSLPCKLEGSIQGFATLWLRRGLKENAESLKLLFVNDLVVEHDTPYKVDESRTLKIKSVTVEDAGVFNCTLSVPGAQSVIYTVNVDKERPRPVNTKHAGHSNRQTNSAPSTNCQMLLWTFVTPFVLLSLVVKPLPFALCPERI